MKDIDYIALVVEELAPHLPRVKERFEEENARYKELLARDHDVIGRVLKCHIILENYIDRHLEAASPLHNWQDAQLRFIQKVDLLPKDNPKVRWILPGIREINKLRNRLGHRIDAEISYDALHNCLNIMEVAREGKQYDSPAELVEAFTTLACTWLITDNEIEQLFNEAFNRARHKHENI